MSATHTSPVAVIPNALIQRVTAAIFDELDRQGVSISGNEKYESRVARAAIEAMREPTEAMLDGWFPPVDRPATYTPEYEGWRNRRGLLQTAYRAMIDAALAASAAAMLVPSAEA